MKPTDDDVVREMMEFDVVIVGAGPCGLSAAIKLAQLSAEAATPISICVLEKGSEVGAHILSGAVLEPTALDELLPQWRELNAPIHTEVKDDHIYLMRSYEKATRLPNFMVPKTMMNHGNYIVSMGNVCRWLARQAESLGVEIFPGFAAASTIIEDGVVKGVITGDMGVGANGKPKDGYMPGMELRAKYTLFAEGCRGHLGKELIKAFALDQDSDPQHYAIGFKEVWDVPAEVHEEGLVMHGAGWPLGEASGGSYMYHAENNQILIGLIVDLNYQNPHLDPFKEFQKMKHHPLFAKVLGKGKRVTYGARAIAKGGINALPKMTMPGALLLGCDAGTLNFSKIKGNHTAMKSGMIGADVVFAAIQEGLLAADLTQYDTHFVNSWLGKELKKAKNFGAVLHRCGNILGGAINTLEQNILGGRCIFNFRDLQSDHEMLKPAAEMPQIQYPAPDNKLSFDRLSSVFLSNTNHEEDQPCHLQLKQSTLPMRFTLPTYAEPAQRYCPAGVYEIVEQAGEPALQINAQNCIHCKTCDIKEPSQNIRWFVPEGMGGPNYPNM
jgi:electron-transferring-flavoprotein dehydrogenase